MAIASASPVLRVLLLSLRIRGRLSRSLRLSIRGRPGRRLCLGIGCRLSRCRRFSFPALAVLLLLELPVQPTPVLFLPPALLRFGHGSPLKGAGLARVDRAPRVRQFRARAGYVNEIH